MNPLTRPLQLMLVCLIPLALPPVALAARGDDAQLRKVFEQAAEAVVVVKYKTIGRASGRAGDFEGAETGLVVTPDGLVMTQASLFEAPALDAGNLGEDPRFREIHVIFADGRRHEAQAVGWDRDAGVAFVRIADATGMRLPCARLVERLPRIAEQVMVVGVLPEAYQPSRTFIVTRVNAVIDKPAQVAITTDRLGWLAGGPVVSLRGEVLGVVGRERALASGGLAQLGGTLESAALFAHVVIPAARFVRLLHAPPSADQPAAKGFLGIEMQPVNAELARYLRLPQLGGIHVSAVIKGSPAQDAGLKPGDILLRMDGAPIEVTRDEHLEGFRRWVRGYAPGTPVRLHVWRDGQTREIELRIGAAPRLRETARGIDEPALGLTVRELTVDVLMALDLDADAPGVVVSDIEPAGPAHIGKLDLGDIIQRIDDEVVEGLDSFQRILGKAREEERTELLFFVRRRADTIFLSIKPDWTAKP